MRYTIFNQHGRAYASGDSVNELCSFVGSQLRFYFVMDDDNNVVYTNMKGRKLPVRTSRGTPKQ